MEQKQSKIFRCRVGLVRGSLVIYFRKAFWRGVHIPYRLYFYEVGGWLYMSFADPSHLPMYKVYPRRLQTAGRYGISHKAIIPSPFVKEYDLRRFNIVEMNRFKFYNKGISHKCHFKTEPHKPRKTLLVIKPPRVYDELPLEDLLR